jgi:hypothetical protein
MPSEDLVHTKPRRRKKTMIATSSLSLRVFVASCDSSVGKMKKPLPNSIGSGFC